MYLKVARAIRDSAKAQAHAKRCHTDCVELENRNSVVAVIGAIYAGLFLIFASV